MAKIETNTEYLNASPEDFSDKVQALLATERAAYDMLKAARADVLAQVKAELPMPAGREVKQTVYTRWGQWQIVVGDTVAPKAKVGARQSLSEFLASQTASGLRS